MSSPIQRLWERLKEEMDSAIDEEFPELKPPKPPVLRYQDYEVVHTPGEKPKVIPINSGFRIESYKETHHGTPVRANEWRGTAEPVSYHAVGTTKANCAREAFKALPIEEKLSLLREWEAQLMAERIFQDPLAEDTHGRT